MAIVSLFRRYKRWNPVHPTYGAFWGIGLGLGCGVGWGPGFGPEVVGYVGSGCGVGFSMGVTLVGVGIGLPASGLTCLPCNVVAGAGQGAYELTTVWAVPVVSGIVKQSWDSICIQATIMDKRLRDGDHWRPPTFEDCKRKFPDLFKLNPWKVETEQDSTRLNVYTTRPWVKFPFKATPRSRTPVSESNESSTGTS